MFSMKKLTQSIFYSFILFIIPYHSNAQAFLNGSFETTIIVGDHLNYDNPTFDSVMPYTTSFGSLGNIDVLTSPDFCGLAEAGSWYIGLTGAGTDAINMELSMPLVSGNFYLLSFWERSCDPHTSAPIQVGVSGVSDSIGTVIYTATDPAPLEMFETTIRFKPKSAWRSGMTPAKLIDERDRTVKVPGLANFWIPPIRNRIDMLATGIKSPIGIKVSGANLEDIDRTARQIEAVAKTVPGISSALAERLSGGRYIDVAINRAAAARYGLNVADVQAVVSGAIGGAVVGQTREGLAR